MSQLVLSRKLKESVLIGSDIVVTVVQVRGDRVKLAFSAPNEVVIVRSELIPPAVEPSHVGIDSDSDHVSGRGPLAGRLRPDRVLAADRRRSAGEVSASDVCSPLPVDAPTAAVSTGSAPVATPNE